MVFRRRAVARACVGNKNHQRQSGGDSYNLGGAKTMQTKQQRRRVDFGRWQFLKTIGTGAAVAWAAGTIAAPLTYAA